MDFYSETFMRNGVALMETHDLDLLKVRGGAVQVASPFRPGGTLR